MLIKSCGDCSSMGGYVNVFLAQCWMTRLTWGDGENRNQAITETPVLYQIPSQWNIETRTRRMNELMQTGRRGEKGSETTTWTPADPYLSKSIFHFVLPSSILLTWACFKPQSRPGLIITGIHTSQESFFHISWRRHSIFPESTFCSSYPSYLEVFLVELIILSYSCNRSSFLAWPRHTPRHREKSYSTHVITSPSRNVAEQQAT